MPLKEDDELIVATMNGLHWNTSEDDFCTALNRHSAKSLRRACANLGLGARSRRSAYDNKNGYMKLLWECYKRDGMAEFSGLSHDTEALANGHGITSACRPPNPVLSRPDSQEVGPELRLRTTSSSQTTAITEPLLQSVGGNQARKRRRVATADGILEFVEQDDLTERRGESDKIREDKGYDAVVRASAAVRAAIATLNELKDNHASECLVKAAELVFDRLVLSWTRTMEEASKM
ncbi:unnamed protein product [Peronospora destructor]|uniref:Myb/SANT-like domain-containing protein n=1 Tax=Peronospora destructor TaxID=86335 RepID=A0AAV0V5V7_9STRA|nr:unnamed protein product [Peronospora destructor]